MKKILLVVALAFLLVGCGTSKQEAKMEEYAKDYYTKFMSKVDNGEKFITLYRLRQAKELNQATYDLKALEKCKDDTSVTLVISGGKIKEVKKDMKCD